MELSAGSTTDVSKSAAVGTTVIVFRSQTFFTFTGLAYETELPEAVALAHRAGAQTRATLCVSTSYLVVGSHEGTRKRLFAEGIFEAEVVPLDVFTAAAQAACEHRSAQGGDESTAILRVVVTRAAAGGTLATAVSIVVAETLRWSYAQIMRHMLFKTK
ncbi:hypothetical protein JL721_2453 [Aureococcus anophagefferens]|nr:hypothetical protein JL721_2453 [Aureococcus anophagefferens]